MFTLEILPYYSFATNKPLFYLVSRNRVRHLPEDLPRYPWVPCRRIEPRKLLKKRKHKILYNEREM